MSLTKYSKEEVKEMSLIEIAYELLVEQKRAVAFKDIIDEIATIRGITQKEISGRIAQFYTDLNIDGRFLAIGDNQWGLRVWYPVDQVVEEIVNPVKAKKKKAKKVIDELDLDAGFDDVEDLVEDDIFDDEDDDLEDDDLLDDVLLDEDLDDDDELLDDDDLEEDEFEIDDEEEEDLDDSDDELLEDKEDDDHL